jgi:PLP dependent protein
LEDVQQRMVRAAEKCGRGPEEVRLVAVSKTFPAESVSEAFQCGATVFGENYIQEARDKIATLGHLDISWHFIGHLQRNKSKYAVKLFDLIHAVDSIKLARELNKEAAKIDKIQEILVQVNISGEETKSGVDENGATELIKGIATLEHLAIKGLMTMPPFFDDPDRARPYFQALRLLGDHIRGLSIPRVSMHELSMGMTGDFEVAIEEGATLVRVGTAIFGAR